jgi:hypothetical protein
MQDRSVHPIGREPDFFHQGADEITPGPSVVANMASSLLYQKRFLDGLEG